MSCITLAYDLKRVDPGNRQFPYSLVAQRWFEGLAAGCVVVGYRPNCPEADELLNWQDATLECPEDPEQFLQFIDELVIDPGRVAAIRQANFQNMLQAHDWGYRVVAILAAMGIHSASKWIRRHTALMQMSDQAKG
jgi:hypothetical protein